MGHVTCELVKSTIDWHFMCHVLPSSRAVFSQLQCKIFRFYIFVNLYSVLHLKGTLSTRYTSAAVS
jgi:hypothetical protein